MLDESEWEQVLPHLQAGIEQIQNIRQTHGVGLYEAKIRVYGEGALRRYFEITGFRETNVNAIWHHRLSLFGPPCSSCGKLLRTPRAKFCAACGTQVEIRRA
ncbi:hypothetical protein CO675_03310 [Bradyrhizobium sp. C9]|nr:hypothetical protein CO675_03310 [Bradyrhizobium sp. C9]